MTHESKHDAIVARLDAARRERLRANATRLVEEGGPEKAAEARGVLAALDRAAARERADKQAAAEGPLKDRVLRSFRRTPPNETERKLLQVVFDAPGSTSAALSRRVGYDGQAWHLHFGTMCARRQDTLGPAPSIRKSGDPFWTGVLCDFDAEAATWTLRPEVAAALSDLGFRAAR